MKIVIIGGHLAPALSVIEELGKDAEILYIGRRYALEGDKAISLEYEVITQKGIDFAILKTGRMQRNITRYTIPSLTRVPIGFSQAWLILKKFKPSVVVGFGGYVSFPVILAAKILRIPIVIHEQTLEAGATNKFVSKFANKVCISFESSRKYFPRDKTVLTGNPIRETILHPRKKILLESNDPIIYITGGSLGSHAINMLVEKCLSEMLDKYSVIHQTGAAAEFNDFEKLVILKEGLNIDKRNKYLVTKHFLPEEVGEVLKISKLVVARAGINTVSELVTLEKPSYLIPLPISQKDEQMKNALFLKNLGLGETGQQKSLTPQLFISQINRMMQNLGSYKLKSTATHFPKNAASKIVEVIYASSKNPN